MTETIASLPPGFVLFAGALAVPLLPWRAKRVWVVALPLASFAHLLLIPEGTVVRFELFGAALEPVRVDSLSLVWGYIFHLAALLNAIYALHVRDDVQQVATPLYEGAAIAAVFAGDLVSLFVGWELTAITSVFLIWARRSPRSLRAGMRYLVIQVGSGVLLMGGAAIRYAETGSLAFSGMELGQPGAWPLFCAFGIKAAFPLLHNWLQDAYPEATVTGTVVLSVFTTKLAIYALARGFPGTELLVPIGAVMTAFPIFYAVIENDLRRVLAYSLNNQLGFMVVGVGIGSELALNGTAAYVFCNVLFEGLLFMTMGAVLDRTGTIKGSELGGLWKSMPWTAGCCIVGAVSISAFPLFSGFVSKSLILSAAAEEHYTLTFIVLLFASAGVFHHSGIKIPYFAFFAHDSGIRCQEARPNMLVAMGATAALCIGLGCFPGLLYSILPYDVGYQPYTPTHVITQLQLLLFSALCFGFLQLSGLYPPELRSTNLDSDWVYRRALPLAIASAHRTGSRQYARVRAAAAGAASGLLDRLFALHGPDGALGRPWPTGTTVLWVAALLGALLVLYYL